jgi:tripartite-type tricarboxylate transporter receptor subunit TctC
MTNSAPRFAFILTLLAAAAHPALAQTYPTRPIRMLVAFPPGGPADVVGRIVAKIVTDSLGQQVVVDNRPGAAGTIGIAALVKSPADGYTLGIGSSSNVAIAPSVQLNVPYDPVKDIAPLTNVAFTPGALLANASLPADTIQQLIAYAKANPGRINYASTGIGTSPHLAFELFATRAGVKFNHIPYKGAAPALLDLMAGAIPLSSDASLTAALQNIRTGKLKVLAVTSERRSALMPNVPTVAESGLPGYEATTWYGLIAPRGLPRELVVRLHDVVVKGLQTPEAVARLATIGAEVIGNTPEAYGRTIRDDTVRWAKLVKAIDLKPE